MQTTGVRPLAVVYIGMVSLQAMSDVYCHAFEAMLGAEFLGGDNTGAALPTRPNLAETKWFVLMLAAVRILDHALSSFGQRKSRPEWAVPAGALVAYLAFRTCFAATASLQLWGLGVWTLSNFPSACWYEYFASAFLFMLRRTSRIRFALS